MLFERRRTPGKPWGGEAEPLGGEGDILEVFGAKKLENKLSKTIGFWKNIRFA